jgi:hypothetical protein
MVAKTIPMADKPPVVWIGYARKGRKPSGKHYFIMEPDDG